MRRTPEASASSRTSSLPLAVALTAAVSALWYTGQRVRVPKNVRPVQDFDAEQYMGHWYELARIDYVFERGLTSCTADYCLQDDGTVQVTNRGFDPERGQWKSATAVAKLLSGPEVGSLKVSFFRPLYAGYHVVYVDHDAGHAVVVGDAAKYAWILSRTPSIDEAAYTRLVAIAASNGVDASRLIRVPHGAALEMVETSKAA
ncbi:MAG: lipocalin family protein [Comamonas sp.]|jgi:apolipoprotein D and lipocalin family protein|nr:lipocalin family protein [Comamonas sp.]